jgi:hypothetical protein
MLPYLHYLYTDYKLLDRLIQVKNFSILIILYAFFISSMVLVIAVNQFAKKI